MLDKSQIYFPAVIWASLIRTEWGASSTCWCHMVIFGINIVIATKTDAAGWKINPPSIVRRSVSISYSSSPGSEPDGVGLILLSMIHKLNPNGSGDFRVPSPCVYRLIWVRITYRQVILIANLLIDKNYSLISLLSCSTIYSYNIFLRFLL